MNVDLQIDDLAAKHRKPSRFECLLRMKVRNLEARNNLYLDSAQCADTYIWFVVHRNIIFLHSEHLQTLLL